MKILNTLMIASLGLIAANPDLAQSPRRPQPSAPSATKPSLPAPTPTPVTSAPMMPAQPYSPVSIAIVNGQTITTADIDPAAREQVEQLDQKIAVARRQIRDLQINTVLLALEARKRGTTAQQLYDAEVTKRVTDPTEAEITQFTEANRSQLNDDTPQNIRMQVVSLLRGDREQKLADELVRRLRAANPVTAGVDVNTPNLNQSAVVATVAGQPITAAIVIERLKPIIYKLRLSTYQIERPALDQTIDDLLLIAEANKRSLPPEQIVRSEVTEKVRPPTAAEITKFYADNKARIAGDLPSVRNQIASYLEQQKRIQLERAFSDRLRKGADIRVLLTEPERPVQTIDTAGEPSRGDATAPVTLVEFTDFECPSCAAMQPVLEEVLKAYGNRVRFVVRNFPLSRHTHARKAAEAADAANAQGKFFDYTSLLFKRQNALDVPSLKKYATEIGLDRTRFDAELDSGKYAAAVKHDTDDGDIYGIDSTPTIFINGVMLVDLSPAGLRAAIDKALSKSLGR